ncbi:hypothetical protein EEJ42_22685 [Streptomyces botrytidirepellens]|uniref:Uncharacterized protein n=1 Tax=Streptomyces botrytidirepellens TaxID=2486417 RepID=A0A3M8VTW4_9ACTN|nr:hypothetical protein EEJ42_22685 [Streptomyces botrytidirepellens]
MRSKTQHAGGDGDRFALPFDVDQTLGRFHGREELGDLCVLQDSVSPGLSEALTACFDVFTQVCAGLFLVTLWLSRQPDPGAYDGYEQQDTKGHASVE